MKKIVFLTGAGISKESGIPTFRDAGDGLWENCNVQEVATHSAIVRNPDLVYKFINELRNKYKDCTPNEAHKLIAELEKDYDYNSFSSDYTWSSKTILCADYSFNLDEKIPCSLRMDLVLRTGINNNIGLTNVYPNKEIQEG